MIRQPETCDISLLYFNSQQFYWKTSDTENRPLYLEFIESTHPCIDIFNSVRQLCNRLRISRNDILGAILIISTISELIDLVYSQELLEDFPMALILQFDDPDTNSLGHLLSPRYLATRKHNDLEIKCVLAQFVRKLKMRSPNGIYGS